VWLVVWVCCDAFELLRSYVIVNKSFYRSDFKKGEPMNPRALGFGSDNPFGLGEPESPSATDPMEAEIQKSVSAFEARFGAMAPIARNNGWVADFEKEVRRLVRLAREIPA
jgi:hypothetical protein